MPDGVARNNDGIGGALDMGEDTREELSRSQSWQSPAEDSQFDSARGDEATERATAHLGDRASAVSSTGSGASVMGNRDANETAEVLLLPVAKKPVSPVRYAGMMSGAAAFVPTSVELSEGINERTLDEPEEAESVRCNRENSGTLPSSASVSSAPSLRTTGAGSLGDSDARTGSVVDTKTVETVCKLEDKDVGASGGQASRCGKLPCGKTMVPPVEEKRVVLLERRTAVTPERIRGGDDAERGETSEGKNLMEVGKRKESDPGLSMSAAIDVEPPDGAERAPVTDSYASRPPRPPRPPSAEESISVGNGGVSASVEDGMNVAIAGEHCNGGRGGVGVWTERSERDSSVEGSETGDVLDMFDNLASDAGSVRPSGGRDSVDVVGDLVRILEGALPRFGEQPSCGDGNNKNTSDISVWEDNAGAESEHALNHGAGRKGRVDIAVSPATVEDTLRGDREPSGDSSIGFGNWTDEPKNELHLPGSEEARGRHDAVNTAAADRVPLSDVTKKSDAGGATVPPFLEEDVPAVAVSETSSSGHQAGAVAAGGEIEILKISLGGEDTATKRVVEVSTSAIDIDPPPVCLGTLPSDSGDVSPPDCSQESVATAAKVGSLRISHVVEKGIPTSVADVEVNSTEARNSKADGGASEKEEQEEHVAEGSRLRDDENKRTRNQAEIDTTVVTGAINSTACDEPLVVFAALETGRTPTVSPHAVREAGDRVSNVSAEGDDVAASEDQHEGERLVVGYINSADRRVEVEMSLVASLANETTAGDDRRRESSDGTSRNPEPAEKEAIEQRQPPALDGERLENDIVDGKRHASRDGGTGDTPRASPAVESQALAQLQLDPTADCDNVDDTGDNIDDAGSFFNDTIERVGDEGSLSKDTIDRIGNEGSLSKDTIDRIDSEVLASNVKTVDPANNVGLANPANRASLANPAIVAARWGLERMDGDSECGPEKLVVAPSHDATLAQNLPEYLAPVSGVDGAPWVHGREEEGEDLRNERGVSSRATLGDRSSFGAHENAHVPQGGGVPKDGAASKDAGLEISTNHLSSEGTVLDGPVKSRTKCCVLM